MRLNFFEGSRRILYLLMCLYVVGVAAYAYLEKPYVPLRYSVIAPGYAPTLTEKDCGFDDWKEYTEKTISGQTINVSICFMAVDSSKGDRIVLFKREDGRYWGADRWSNEVATYARDVARAFELAESDLRIYEARRQTAVRELRKQALIAAFVGLAVLWILATVIGWIARGFAGIPRGMDRRPHDRTNP